jgi:hypothetical protein
LIIKIETIKQVLAKNIFTLSRRHTIKLVCYHLLCVVLWKENGGMVDKNTSTYLRVGQCHPVEKC